MNLDGEKWIEAARLRFVKGLGNPAVGSLTSIELSMR